MIMTIDLTSVAADEMEQAEATAKKLLSQFVSETSETSEFFVMMGGVVVRGVAYITIDCKNTTISLLNLLEEEIASMPLSELRFLISTDGKEAYKVTEV